MHKKLHLLLIIMVILAGFLFYTQIKKSSEITVKKNPVALISATASYIPESNTDFVFGNPGADNIIVEFIDISCKECMKLHNEIKTVISAHPQDIRLIWKDAPQPKLISRNSTLAHQAAWCAGQKNEKKFWQFIETVAQDNSNLAEQELKKIGAGLDLEFEAWWTCTNSASAKQKITDSLAIANGLHLDELPAIFVNNKRINTSADINLTEMLESFIKK